MDYSKITRNSYVEYLNNYVPDIKSDEWIIGGKNRSGCYPKYGKAVRRCDPIGFEVGFQDWTRDTPKKRHGG